MYDYLIVGSGLFGAVFANEIKQVAKKCLVIDKRDHIGGNIYTENRRGINVHKYGPHVFHTNKKHIWDYVNRFAEFNNFVNEPKVNYKGKIYSFPINMMTLHQLWGVNTPEEAEQRLKKERIPCDNPDNIEDYALATWGREIYETFIYGYTKKQWSREPKDLPASIIKRLPFRLTFNDNYYLDRYQGIPVGGYTRIIENLLDGVDVDTNVDFKDVSKWRKIAKKLVYTGPIDEFFDYKYGELEYRSLRFEEVMCMGDYQGNAVINYTSENESWTRIIEHKHFEGVNTKETVITVEYPQDWDRTKIPYYPINDDKNTKKYRMYREEADKLEDVIFGGILGCYKYIDMDDTISIALKAVEKEFNAIQNLS